MNFPSASSEVYYNEDGEVLGWDAPLDFETEFPEEYGFDRYYEDEDVWGDEEACKREGYHGESGNSVTDRDDVWQCTACGSLYPRD